MHTQRQFSLLTLVLVVTAIGVWLGLVRWIPLWTVLLTVIGILIVPTVLLIHRRIAIALSATICALPATLALWAWITHWKWERQAAYAHNTFPWNKLARDLTLVTCVCVAIVAIAWLVKAKRRWFQFSLRTLLLLTALSAALMGVYFHPSRQQGRAVAALRQLGGVVVVTEPAGPGWLRKVFGEEHCVNAIECELNSIPSLESDRYFPITDDDARHLKALKNLRTLTLKHADITDEGMENLTGLNHLTKLELVDLHGVTDEGLKNIRGLRNLRELYIFNLSITDAGLGHLSGLSGLEDLYLLEIPTTDAGLEHLKGLTNLKRLELYHTLVTDAGLEHLKGLANLQELRLYGTHVTDAGIADLQNALPQVDIRR